MIPVNSVKVVLSTTMKLTIVHLSKIYAGINYSEMDQIMPIILDKENIPPHALEDHSHVAIGNATTDSCSEMDQNTPNTLDKENIPSDAHEYQSHVGTSTATTTSGALSVPNGNHFVIILCKNT